MPLPTPAFSVLKEGRAENEKQNGELDHAPSSAHADTKAAMGPLRLREVGEIGRVDSVQQKRESAMWYGVVCMRGRGRGDLLNVQPLEAITIVNALDPAAEEERHKREQSTYWFQSLDEQPFLVGNVILERSLQRTKGRGKGKWRLATHQRRKNWSRSTKKGKPTIVESQRTFRTSILCLEMWL
jgi:hypothetical protein